MARRVVSLVRSAPRALWGTDPVLEANAYAVAEDVEVSLVLAGDAVELALAHGQVPPGELAGVALPPAASGQDLRGLLESGIGVFVLTPDLDRRGLHDGSLVDGVARVDEDGLARLLGRADAVVTW